MKQRKWWLIFLAVILVATVNVLLTSWKHNRVSARNANHSPSRQTEQSEPAYDVWGQTVSAKEAKQLLKTEQGRAFLSPHNGAVVINEPLLKLGQKTFREETFGNEVFITDILGLVNGAFTVPGIKKAIAELHGDGTDNLRVELAQTVTIGGKTFNKGAKIDTGLDVARGAKEVLGLPFKESGGKTKVGITCLACHAIYDTRSKTVVEGPPNPDVDFGLLFGLATNTAAYFGRSDVYQLSQYVKDINRTVVATDGKKAPLPDPEALEAAVDASLLKWPRGNFDATSDKVNNPTQTLDSFTLGDHPYSWSGTGMAGPFKGQSVLNNNVNAVGSDLTTLADSSQALFGIDKEVFLGAILQNAADPKFRFDPKTRRKPSEFFASVDPTPGVAGVNQLVALPTFPRPSLITLNGLLAGSPGYNVWEQINGLSAYQNTLIPPKPPNRPNAQTLMLGERVFRKAQCISCHAGPFLTNNRVVSAEVIGTEPTRAKALSALEKYMVEPVIYSPDTPVPVPPGARVLKVPTERLDPEQIKLAFAQGGSPGGYKVPSLIALYWTAPYLHDGGVAVGPDAKNQLGTPGTVKKGVLPEPANSLRALVDRQLRGKVVAANQASADLRDAHVTGAGHNYWVDASTGFTKKEQDALIQYLLSLTKPKTSDPH